MKGRQQTRRDAGKEVATVDQVVVAQGQNVRLISTVRRSGKANQKLRGKVGQQLPVRWRCSVVKLINDDVIEVLRRKAGQVRGPAQGLNGSAQDVNLHITHLPHVEAHPGTRANPQKSLCRLIQNFFTMGHKQHAASAHLLGIKGSQPRLTQAGSQHNQAALVAGITRGAQGLKRLNLHGRGFRRGLFFIATGCNRTRWHYAPRLIGINPGIGQWHGPRIAEHRFKTMARLQKTVIRRIVHAVIPLKTIRQPLPADVA